MGTSPPEPPTNKKGTSILKRPQNELGVAGVLWLLVKSTKEEESLGFYWIHKDLLSLAFKRIGRAGPSAFRS